MAISFPSIRNDESDVCKTLSRNYSGAIYMRGRKFHLKFSAAFGRFDYPYHYTLQ